MKSMPHCIRSLEYEQCLYGLLRPQALDDLRDLYSYVAFSLKERATAESWLTGESARLLAHWMPCPGGTLLWTGNRGRAWGCRFTVENFLLFYLIDQSTRTVTLVRIVYGGRDLQNLAK